MIVNLSTPQNNYLERTDTLTRYCEDIRRYTPLSVEREQELIKIYHLSKNPKEKLLAKEELLCANQRFALGVAKRWATNDNLMDLISEANIGMSEALDEYDINQNVRFITFAVYYMRRAINSYMVKNGCMVRKNNVSKTFHLMSQITNKFMQKEGRQPSSDEIIEILNEDYGVEVKNTADVLTIQMTSIDENYDKEDEEHNMNNIMSFNEVSATSNECENDSEKDFAKVMVTSVLKKLTPVEQEVIKYAFGIGYMREYEIQEIADKLDFSSERIRQLKIQALDKIKKEYKKLVEKL